jgi:hypothetical protein
MCHTFTEPAREVPVAWRGDLCVVGGSCTGVFAAVRAARLGLSVALIEQHAILGGSATAAQVNEWHSIRDARQCKQIIGGLTMEVVERLRARGALAEVNPIHRVQFRFNSAELALELDALVRENRIRLFLCARLASAVREGNRIRAAIIEDKSGRRAVAARVFIDASGDGDLLRRAGFDAWKSPALQPVNMQALVAGFAALNARYPNNNFWSDIGHLAQARGFPSANAIPWICNYPGPQDLNSVFGPRLNGVDASDADQLTDAIIEGRRLQRAYTDMAREVYPDAPLHIVALPHALGVRETWHAGCLHRLTGTELLGGAEFPDTIGYGTYPVDIHSAEGTVLRYLDGREEVVKPGGEKVWQRWCEEGENFAPYYQIPYRCLVPRDAANLLVAGRLIDADREAFGAVRVMVSCNQMGEAAGSAAAIAVRGDLEVASVDPVDLRAALIAGGSIFSATLIRPQVEALRGSVQRRPGSGPSPEGPR